MRRLHPARRVPAGVFILGVLATLLVPGVPAASAQATPETSVAGWQQSSGFLIGCTPCSPQFLGRGVKATPVVTNVKAVAVGRLHALALHEDGTVSGWGARYTAPPQPLAGVVAVAIADLVSVALGSDGTLVQWGANAPAAPGIGDVAAIAAAGRSSVQDRDSDPELGYRPQSGVIAAVKKDGTVVYWTLRYPLAFGPGSPLEMSVPVQVQGLSDVASVSLSGFNAFALHRDGSVSRFNLTYADAAVQRLPDLTDVTAIAAGGLYGAHGIALRRNGTVTAWGDNGEGQATVPVGLANVVAIAAGPVHSLALKNDGTVVGWGRGYDRPRDFPAELSGVVAIAAGEFSNLAVTTMTAPSRPEGLTVRTVGAAVEARWSMPGYKGTRGVTGFRVVVQPGATQIDLPATATSHQVGSSSSQFPITVTVQALSRGVASPAATARLHRNDVAVFRPSNSTWYRRGLAPVQFGRPGDVPVAGDYDGDGTTDIAVFRPATGSWHIRNLPTVALGRRGDIPVPADYDLDGRTDPAVFRPSDGTWHLSVDPRPMTFGTAGDVPFANTRYGARDRRTPPVWIAVYRPRNATWWPGGHYGAVGDIPVPADYLGDGSSEVAVFRPSNGTWYRRHRAATRYGAAGDLPLPGDYGGDGAADIAVFRPSNANWYVLGQPSFRFGRPGDVPIPPQRGPSPSVW